MPDYTTVDLTVRVNATASGWEFAAGLRNLFNADAREPDPSVPMQIPKDVPLAGRSFYLQLMRAL